MVTIEVDAFMVKVNAICTVVLYAKYCLTLTVGAEKKFLTGSRPPEDGIFAGSTCPPQNFKISRKGYTNDSIKKKSINDDLRFQRIVANDLENIPFFLIFAWCSLLCRYSIPAHILFVCLFTISRVAHSYSFAKGFQPHRVVLFLVGLLSTCGVLGNLLLGAIAI